MTIKQKSWADYFIQSGNKADAARKAGYSERSAAFIGNENYNKPYIREYIDEEIAKLDSKRIASRDEVLQFFTSTMRGEITDQFGLDPSLSDRLDAGKQLAKRYGIDKIAIVGGDKDDNPISVESVQIILPDNGRGKNE